MSSLENKEGSSQMSWVDNASLMRGEIFVPTNLKTPRNKTDVSVFVDLINIFANYTSHAASKLDDFSIPLLYDAYVPQSYIERSFIPDILEDIHLEKNFWFNVRPYLWHWVLIERVLKLTSSINEIPINNVYLLVPTNRYPGIDLNEVISWVARRLGGKFKSNLLFIDDAVRLKTLAQASKYNVLLDTSKKRASDWCDSGGISMWYPEISDMCTGYVASQAIFTRLEALGFAILREYQLDFPSKESSAEKNSAGKA